MRAETGTVNILNVCDGDTTLTFDNKNPEETKRAAKIVKDMIRRGYCLLVCVGKKNGEPIYQRAHDFDENTCEYIIASVNDETIDVGIESTKKKSSRKKTTTRIKAVKTKVVSVGRTAGG